MKDIRISATCQCEECGGSGVTQHYAWAEYWKEHSDRSVEHSPEEQEQWFEERGYMRDGDLHMGRSVRLYPPEEVPCMGCEGSGRQDITLPLRALSQLIANPTTEGRKNP